MLCTHIRTPNNPYNINLPPHLGKKLKETLQGNANVPLALWVEIKKPINQLQCECEFLLLCHCTYLSPPSSTAVRVTLTNDLNKIFKSLQSLEPKGKINFVTGIRIAHVSNYIHTLVAVYMYMSTCVISFVTIPKYMCRFTRHRTQVHVSFHSSPYPITCVVSFVTIPKYMCYFIRHHTQVHVYTSTWNRFKISLGQLCKRP